MIKYFSLCKLNLNIALDDLIKLSLAIQDKRLLLLKCLKLVLILLILDCIYSRQLICKLGKGSLIDVMSNDTAMSYAVELLDQVGIQSTYLNNWMSQLK
jgi:hypothetical protein